MENTQELYNTFLVKGENGMKAAERLIATAEEQVGYLGKKSNAQLNDFKANAGGRFNKFARDLDALGDFYNSKKQGFDWCDVFVDWCFVATFGRGPAQKLLCQPDKSCGAGRWYSMNYYKAKGRFFTSPQPGDQILFGTVSATQHTGIVVAAAVTAGITDGKRPHDFVIREEAAIMALRSKGGADRLGVLG